MTQEEADREQAQEAILRLYLRRLVREPGTRKGDRPLDQKYHLDRTDRAAAAYFNRAKIAECGFERRRKNPERQVS